ncbi:hypothetical protein WJM97_04865 [Okeanomitos corallinicola TIOX110]|uniref:Uncharacterized protein n=1 Tax=Okeanomitos corallinicola TIOX110 TaxID=3133117 RepID=A0ABZ2UUF3_9CYAN
MLEKLFLASILTFSFGLFAEIGWFEGNQKIVQTPSHQQIVFNSVKNYDQTKIDADRQ